MKIAFITPCRHDDWSRWAAAYGPEGGTDQAGLVGAQRIPHERHQAASPTLGRVSVAPVEQGTAPRRTAFFSPLSPRR